MRRRNALLAILPLVVLAACVRFQQVAPGADSLLPPVQSAAPEAEGAAKPFTGLRLESRVAGSLMDLDFAPGLELTAVTAGSPGEAAGLRVGDRITKAAGKPMATVEQFDAVVAASDGKSIAIEFDRAGGVADLELTPILRVAGSKWQPDRFAERAKGRFVARTKSLANGGFACEIVELLPGSPLADAGIGVGDSIVALDGSSVRDAESFARTIGEKPFGSSVRLTLEAVNGTREVDVDLYSPPRRLNALSLPIVFSYERDHEKDVVRFSLVDLWVIALYSYERNVETVRHRFIGFTIVETGVGEIRADGESEANGGGAEKPR